MEKYQWIVKQKAKGLALFQKVVARLEQVEKELTQAREECLAEIQDRQEEIQAANLEITEQQNAIAFLEKEATSTAETKSKINSFLT